MNKRWAVAGAMATNRHPRSRFDNRAAPKPTDKNTLPFVCDGQEVDIVVAGDGRIGYVDGVKYQAVLIDATARRSTAGVASFRTGTPSPACRRVTAARSR